MAGPASGNVDDNDFVITTAPTNEANINRNAPPNAAAAPAISLKGSMDPPVPADIQKVPPTPMSNIGQIKF